MTSFRISNLSKQFKKETAIASLILAVTIFLSSGLYHLSKFETTDEHFWKYDRIEKYYTGIKQGIKDNNWKKTRLNDKPGATVALISGITVPFGFEPSKHEDLETKNKYTHSKNKKGEGKKLYDAYHVNNTEAINFQLRLPGLLFNALIILPLLFWLLLSLTRNFFVTSLGIITIGANPILIGISQIVNPDTFLWGFSAVSILSFMAYLSRRQKKFLLIAGFATGLSLLSKYTANLLFIFYPIIFILFVYFSQKKKPVTLNWKQSLRKYYKDYTVPFIILTAIAVTTFALLMPEVIQIRKHFLYGTFYSPTLGPIVDIFINTFNLRDTIFFSPTKYKTALMFPMSIAVFCFVTIIAPFIALRLAQKFKKTTKYLLNGTLLLILSIFIFSFANAWTDTPFFSLENIKEESRSHGKLIFPSFANDPQPIFWYKALTVQSQNLIFSLTPIVVFFVLFLWIRVLQNKIRTKKLLPFIYFVSLAMPLAFFVGALLADIFVNIRYSLMLFPFFSILGAIGAYELFLLLRSNQKIVKQNLLKTKYFFVLIFILFHILAIWNIKPYYFNYHSNLLPHKYVVTDSWGYGAYATSSFLNALPDATELTIWTDRRSMCQFFVGHCIVSNEIYLDKVDVDYLIFSRRGMITKKFIPVGSNNPHNITRQRYYNEDFMKKQTVFEEHIGNRPENFIKVIKIKK